MPDTFIIRVETRFHASHGLKLPNGSKEPSHDHDWRVTAEVGSQKLDTMGIVISFQKLRAMMNETVSDFDNASLDSISYFKQNNPSAENVAKYIFEKLRAKLPDGVNLRGVRVVEEPGCSAEFRQ